MNVGRSTSFEWHFKIWVLQKWFYIPRWWMEFHEWIPWFFPLSIVSRLTARNNQINSSSNNHNTSHSDVSKQFIPATIYFPFKEVDFSSLSNVCRPISKSVNNSNHVTAKSILVLPKVSETVKRLYQRRPVKALHILVMSVNKMTVI